MKSSYEIMFIIKSSLDEKSEKEALSKINVLIEKKGKVTLSKSLGKKLLAYPIQGQNQGNYHLLEFQADSDYVGQISKQLGMDENLLRFLIVSIAK